MLPLCEVLQIAIIAVCSLIVIASCLALPIIAGIALIVFAVATAVAGIGAAAMLEVKAGHYGCPHCKALFVPTNFYGAAVLRLRLYIQINFQGGSSQNRSTTL